MPTVYVTAPADAADGIARELVEAELAACVNRVDCQSTYRWEGEIQEDDEVILLAKTTDDAREALVERVEEIHPYDTPAIEVFEEVALSAATREWRERAVTRKDNS